MEYAHELISITLALILVAISPGPAFLIVTQRSISQTRRVGFITALGITTGSLIWVVLIFLGIDTVFQASAWGYTMLKILGGLYLIYLGIQLWRSSSSPVKYESDYKNVDSAAAVFFSTIMVQLLNPKAAIFFGSVFITMLSPDAPLTIKLLALGIVFFIEFGWHVLLAIFFSTKRAQTTYIKMKLYFERIAGSWLMYFGIKLAISER